MVPVEQQTRYEQHGTVYIKSTTTPRRSHMAEGQRHLGINATDIASDEISRIGKLHGRSGGAVRSFRSLGL